MDVEPTFIHTNPLQYSIDLSEKGMAKEELHF